MDGTGDGFEQHKPNSDVVFSLACVIQASSSSPPSSYDCKSRIVWEETVGRGREQRVMGKYIHIYLHIYIYICKNSVMKPTKRGLKKSEENKGKLRVKLMGQF
jgi:hypothetical protein